MDKGLIVTICLFSTFLGCMFCCLLHKLYNMYQEQGLVSCFETFTGCQLCCKEQRSETEEGESYV